ncbi:hypothetical protein H5410_015646 [Solanum commersonii]|uniref:Uncharacterized protein n=1 Tax=Solanum commersonii TaxID=4109 RepID=A0A9J5ZU93_SOLCO|nr:hypothetical protein H5410_015646 [Solanum commersonii]
MKRFSSLSEAFNGQCLARLLTLSQVGRKQELRQREVIGGQFQHASGGLFGEKGMLEALRIEETQIQVTMYGTDITHYENEFVPFQTYFLSRAFVTKSTKAYGIPLYQFTWTIDKGTIVEPIEQALNSVLLKISLHYTYYTYNPFFITILTNNSLLYARYSCPRENGSPPSYASNGSRIQEFIIIDYQSNEIKPLLSTYTTKSTTATGPLLFVPFEEHIIPIVNIQQQSLGQIFHVQAQLSIPNETQRFCVLVCSDCKQIFPRNWSQRRFYCTTCHRSIHLTPRYQENIFTLIKIISVKHSTTSCLLLKNLSYMISFATHTGATHTAREHIHYPNKEAVCKKQGCIFSKIVYHVNHRKDIASNLPLPLTLHQQLQKAVNAS